MKNKLLFLSLISVLFGCSVNVNNSTTNNSNPVVSSSMVSTPASNLTGESSKGIVTPTNPTLNVVKDIKININEKVNYLTLVSAYDTIDGNISHLIEVVLPSGVKLENGDLSFDEVGVYEIVFNVTNSSKLKSTDSIKIEVYKINDVDVDVPVILGYKDIRVKPNVITYPLEGVTATDDFDGNVTSKLIATYQVEGDATKGISFEKEGMYTITLSAKDNAGNVGTQKINIEVNSEDLPTYVNMTESLLIEYNCSITDSSEVPYASALSKEVTLKVKEKQVYANFRIAFEDPIDLENKQLSMYLKAGNNIASNRISLDLLQGSEKVGQKLFTFAESQGNGYKMQDMGNGWFKLTVVFNKLWSTTNYVTDYIRIAYANDDITKTANVFVADVLLDDYVNNGNEDDFEDYPEVAVDLTDTMEVNYNCVHELDKEINHDGQQSLKVKAFDEWTSSKAYVNKDLDGYVITLYFKLDGESMYKNRIYIQFKDESDANIIGDLAISSNDTLQDGVTIGEQDENSWSKVTIDCSKVGLGGVVTRKLNIKFRCSDATAKDGVAWVDELYIMKKEAE